MKSDLSELYGNHLETVQRRFDRALEETGYEAVVIYSGALRMRFLDDMPYPFYTNPHFKTWVPLVDEPECFVVYVAGGRPEVIFHQPVDYWHKPPETPSDFWVDHVDLHIVSDEKQSRERIENLLGGTRKTAFLGEWQGGFEPWLAADTNPPGLVERLHFDRAWKTDYEIECIRRANEIGARGHIVARDAFLSGASEFEIHLEYLAATEQNETSVPYGNIIAINENASVLHYQVQNRDRMRKNLASFLIDAGASFNGYASDITRTWSIEDDDEFSELISKMDSAQLAMCSGVRPGVDYRDVHLDAHRRIAAILEEMNFVSMDPELMVSSGVSGFFFPHGIGHYIGLQVHDVSGFASDRDGTPIPKPEGHPFLRLTRVVEPRQVFTIEPGLYFIDSLLGELRRGEHTASVNWEKVDRFRKYGGVRIEDNIVVTEDGHRNLTREVFPQVS